MSEPRTRETDGPGDRLARFARRGVEAVSAALFAALFIGFLLQIFFRYVLNAPLVWTLEFCLLAYLWMTFWNCGMLMRLNDHIGFTLIYDAMGPAGRRALAVTGFAILGATFAAALPGVIDWTLFMSIAQTDVFGLRLDLVFSIFILFMVAVILRTLVRVRRLAGRDWHRWV